MKSFRLQLYDTVESSLNARIIYSFLILLGPPSALWVFSEFICAHPSPCI